MNVRGILVTVFAVLLLGCGEGSQGETGDTGQQGPPGEAGETGPQGPRGETSDAVELTVESHHNLAFASALITSIATAEAGHAQFSYSPDITVNPGGTIVTDEQVADDDLAGLITLANLGAIPESAEVDAYATTGSDHVFSLDITTQLAANLTFVPADVVRYDGATYTLEFDAVAQGVPASAQLAENLTVVPADVVRYDDATYTREFDAVAQGVPASANVDAVSLDGSDLVLSSDTTVDLGSGVIAADEDLVAVPEPAMAPGVLAGVLTIWLLSARRARRVENSSWIGGERA